MGRGAGGVPRARGSRKGDCGICHGGGGLARTCNEKKRVLNLQLGLADRLNTSLLVSFLEDFAKISRVPPTPGMEKRKPHLRILTRSRMKARHAGIGTKTQHPCVVGPLKRQAQQN